MSNIYLDNNATTYLDSTVRDSMIGVMGNPVNPSSVHQLGRSARTIIEDARSKIVSKLSLDDKYRVVFTATGTEANNLAINGFEGQNVFTSAIEHPSVLNACKQKGGIIVPATKDGVIDVNALEKLLSIHRGKSLISVMLANNETGIIQPVEEVIKVARKWDSLIHIDAVQAFGKIDFDITELDADMVTISAHKISGPQGAAALILKKNISLKPQMIGGGQEQNARAGTENVASICGFGKAVEILQLDHNSKRLRDSLEGQIKLFAPDTVIFGQDKDRLPNTSYLTMTNVSSETQMIHFDMNNIAVSAGSACSSGKIEASHVLKAMGVADEIAKTVIRVSFSKHNTEKDVEEFLRVWKQLNLNINKPDMVA